MFFRTNLETESDSVNTTLQELRLHLAAFIANVINSIPKGVERMKLFTQELRYSLFYLFSSWCELFGISSSNSGEQDSRYIPLHAWGMGNGNGWDGNGNGWNGNRNGWDGNGKCWMGMGMVRMGMGMVRMGMGMVKHCYGYDLFVDIAVNLQLGVHFVSYGKLYFT